MELRGEAVRPSPACSAILQRLVICRGIEMFVLILKILAIAATLTDSIELPCSKSDSASVDDAETGERPRQDDWGICTELVAVRQLTSSPETNKP